MTTSFRQKIPRISIRWKIMAAILATTGILTFVGMGLGSFFGFHLLSDHIARRNSEIAKLLAASIGEALNKEMELIKTIIADPDIADFVIAANRKYTGMKKESMNDYFMGMDKKWVESPADSFLVKEFVENKIGKKLRYARSKAPSISEIFFTDMYGGLCAISRKTSDFYQADERWWQRGFYYGKGNDYIGDVEFDESSKVWAVTFAVPIQDDKNRVIGVCKAVVNLKTFFKKLERFTLGKTGRTFLIDGKGRVIFYKNFNFLNTTLISGDRLQKLVENPRNYGIVKSLATGKTATFIVYAKVRQLALLREGTTWLILVAQDAKEVFQPLYGMFLELSTVLFILIIIFLIASYIFGTLITAPISQLNEVTKRISKGNLDYKLEINTNDEVKELAESFNEMIANIKSKQDEVTKARRKLEEWSKTLEDQVAERTKELLNSQKATLNIMEDLREAYTRLKDTQDQLVQAEKMEAIGILASGIAHEVKNPLGIIIQGVNYLEGKMSSPQKEDMEILNMLKHNIKRADDIIRTLIDFSRKEELRAEPEDVNKILESAFTLIQHRVRIEGIKIVKEVERNLPRILADKGKIEQVFINILLNAIQAMHSGGTLHVRSYLTSIQDAEYGLGKEGWRYFTFGEKTVVVEFKDSGAGIAEGTIKKIFDPFYTTKNPGEGTGLGLSVTKRIIDLHKGRIDVESKVGQGTKVTVYFKIA